MTGASPGPEPGQGRHLPLSDVASRQEGMGAILDVTGHVVTVQATHWHMAGTPGSVLMTITPVLDGGTVSALCLCGACHGELHPCPSQTCQPGLPLPASPPSRLPSPPPRFPAHHSFPSAGRGACTVPTAPLPA